MLSNSRHYPKISDKLNKNCGFQTTILIIERVQIQTPFCDIFTTLTIPSHIKSEGAGAGAMRIYTEIPIGEYFETKHEFENCTGAAVLAKEVGGKIEGTFSFLFSSESCRSWCSQTV